MKQKFKKNFFHIYLSILFMCTTLIFTLQGLDIFKSDLRAHILAGINPDKKSYSLLHFFFKILNKLISIIKRVLIEAFNIKLQDVEKLYNSNDGVMFYFIIALFLSTLILITILMVRWYFISKYNGKIDTFNIEIIIASLFILSTIWIPFSIEGITKGNIYRGNGSGNLWHNPTALICRVFIFPTYYLVISSYNKYKENRDYKKDLLLLSIFAALCMFSKPNFLAALIPAYMIYLFIELIHTKMKSFKYSILTGIAFVPSVLLLYYQSILLFNEKNKAIFEFGGRWKSISENIPISILLALAFPIYVLFIYRKKVLSNIKLTLIWMTQIIAGMQFFFLIEEGKRANHGNFSWGYSITMALLFCISSEVFFLEEEFNDKQKKVGKLIFTAHLVSGIIYFLRILLTGKWAV